MTKWNSPQVDKAVSPCQNHGDKAQKKNYASTGAEKTSDKSNTHDESSQKPRNRGKHLPLDKEYLQKPSRPLY